MTFTLIRDTREPEGFGWHFPGTERASLPTGDYTIRGLEHVFLVERKGSVADLVASMATDRLTSQMARLARVPHPYLVMEFTLGNLIDWPKTCRGLRARGRTPSLADPDAALFRFLRIQAKYPRVRTVFAGDHGQELMRLLCERIIEDHASALMRAEQEGGLPDRLYALQGDRDARHGDSTPATAMTPLRTSEESVGAFASRR